MMVPNAFMQSLSAFVGQNIGAGRRDRARRAMYYGNGKRAVLRCIDGGSRLHQGESSGFHLYFRCEVAAAAWDYLRAYAVDTLLVSFLFCFCGYFNGSGSTTFVMVQGIIGAFLVRIPVSYLMSGIQPVSLFRIGLQPRRQPPHKFCCASSGMVPERERKEPQKPD